MLSHNMSKTEKWLTAFDDAFAGIDTFQSCVSLCDLQGDGDHKLIVGDLSTNLKRLRVYKGVSTMAELPLNDLPVAVCAFHSADASVPMVACAAGGRVYIYKNLKPFYQVTLPSLPIVDVMELEAWRHAHQGDIDADALAQVLRSLAEKVDCQ